MQKTQTITREAFESIYNIACSTWKDKLESWVAEQGLFKSTYKLTDAQVTSMFKSSSSSQIKVLKESGLVCEGYTDCIDLTEDLLYAPNGMVIENPITQNRGTDCIISVRYSLDPEFNHSCYYLSSAFEWELAKDNNTTVLIPKFK